jgi:hypothetical protein
LEVDTVCDDCGNAEHAAENTMPRKTKRRSIIMFRTRSILQGRMALYPAPRLLSRLANDSLANDRADDKL